MDVQVTKDIGRKCADDVSAAIKRNMTLLATPQEKMVITAYAAAAAIGSASGAFSAVMDGPEDIDAAFVEQLWTDFLRPMVLGEFARGLGSLP